MKTSLGICRDGGRGEKVTLVADAQAIVVDRVVGRVLPRIQMI